MSTEPSKLERFSAGERFAVNPDAVERELASLWRAAGQSTEGKSPVTRACLWNVVVHLEERPKSEGQNDVAFMEKVVRELPQYLAARAIVLRTQLEAADGPELESWISANCIIAGGGGKLVCSEEVAIAARGRGDRHLPGLVRALLVPQVPTAVVFAGVPPQGRPTMDGLIHAADRVVVHADRSQSPQPLGRIRETMTEVPLGAIDLGWLELSPLRSLLAGLFDPPVTENEISALDQVTFTANPKHHWSAQLMIAWIAGALGGEAPRAIGHGAWRFRRLAGRPLDMVHVEDPAATWPSVELSSTATRSSYAVRATGDTIAEVVGPHISAKKSLGRVNATQLLARALATRSEDPSFGRALKLAGGM